jgi:UDP-N-acetylglucosamine 2-epimerase (non-hydrolysing)
MTARIWIVFGTRPEWIKLAPVLEGLSHIANLQVKSIFTQQQAALAKHYFQPSDFQPPHFLDACSPALGHEPFAEAVADQLVRLHTEEPAPFAVLVQGDTSSALGGARFANRMGIPLIHLEAGLRTHDLSHPFPEEIIRREISTLASLHLATTVAACEALRKEGIAVADILHTGNTLAHLVTSRFKGKMPSPHQVLITCHRRENRGEPLSRLVEMVPMLAIRHPELHFRWLRHPMFPAEMKAKLLHSAVPNLTVEDPLPFEEMLHAYRSTKAIITDSGGMQEEALCLGIPTLVYRKVTERPECIEHGTALLCPPLSGNLSSTFEEVLKLAPTPRPEVYLADQVAHNTLMAIRQMLVRS